MKKIIEVIINNKINIKEIEAEIGKRIKNQKRIKKSQTLYLNYKKYSERIRILKTCFHH